MGWKSVETLPEDNQTVYVVNSEAKTTPARALFLAKEKKFLVLESGEDRYATASNITHWSNIPSN